MEIKFTLRQATAADYDFLFALHAAAMRPYVEATWGEWNAEWQAEYFARKFDPSPRQIIQVNGQDAGVVVVEYRAGDLYLALIELLPPFQGLGIGTQIIQELVTRAWQEGVPLSLHVLKSNPLALELYSRLGFKIVEEEKIRYKLTLQENDKHEF